VGAASKKAKRIRAAAEFDVAAMRRQLATPSGTGVPLTSWTLESIFGARDDQLRGSFQRPVRLAESMRTDEALATALENRLAPQRSIGVEMIPARRNARAESIAAEANALFGAEGVAISSDTLGSIHSDLVNHDIAIGYNVATPREDGSRIDFQLQAWPLECVRWDTYRRQLLTRIDTIGAEEAGAVGGEIPIVHGDGRWVVFQRYELEPWKHGAILAAALVWARHAYALRDWAKGSVAHGSAKIVGEMPAGVALQNTEGLTPDAAAFLEVLRGLVSDDSPIAIRPAGAKTEFVTNNSPAWQIFKELVDNAETAAARIYLGTDATLGAKGGAPGVDVQALFGVAFSRIEGDLKCIEKSLRTGLIEPWCALNFGDSTLAPTRRYKLPDEDADAARASEATRTTAFYDEIDRARTSGFAITPEFVAFVAKKHGVEPPALAPTPAAPAAPALRAVP
jgi:hypothetical protein